MQDVKHTKVGANLCVKLHHPNKGVQFMTLHLSLTLAVI